LEQVANVSKSPFEILLVDDATERTGLLLDLLLCQYGAQELWRERPDGWCEDALLVPTELLSPSCGLG
jgi:hypothetical protein